MTGATLPMGPEWERRAALVAEAEQAKGGLRAFLTMRARYPLQGDVLRCGDCAHFHRHLGGTQRPYPKCHKYGVTSGAATDWKASYPGCGLREARS